MNPALSRARPSLSTLACPRSSPLLKVHLPPLMHRHNHFVAYSHNLPPLCHRCRGRSHPKSQERLRRRNRRPHVLGPLRFLLCVRCPSRIRTELFGYRCRSIVFIAPSDSALKPHAGSRVVANHVLFPGVSGYTDAMTRCASAEFQNSLLALPLLTSARAATSTSTLSCTPLPWSTTASSLTTLWRAPDWPRPGLSPKSPSSTHSAQSAAWDPK